MPKVWQVHLQETQLVYLPLIMLSLAIVLVMSAARDFVYLSGGPPLWLLLMNGGGILILLVLAILAQRRLIPTRFANMVALLGLVTIGLKPIVPLLLESNPSPLYLGTILFASGLALLSLTALIVVQAISLLAWFVFAIQTVSTAQFIGTFIIALLAAVLGMLLQQRRVDQIKQSYQLLTRVEELESLLPMCASCKKTRNESGDWVSVEEYIESREPTQITHGICPDCKESLYGDYLGNRPAQA